MRQRWFQIAAAMMCGMGACAANGPSTHPSSKPATTATTTAPAPITSPANVTEHRQPVAPPPPPPPISPSPSPVPAAPIPAKIPATQPVLPVIVPTTQPGPINDKVAYAVGYSAGRRIHDRLAEDGRTADELQVLKGLIDGLGDRDPAYPRQDVQSAFAEFQAYTLQRRADKQYADNPAFRKRADENLQKSRAILDQNAQMAGIIVRPDGVQVREVAPGNGRIVGNAKAIVFKSLSVALVDGTLIKSTEADQTEKVPSTEILPALMSAIRGMPVGGKFKVWLPPDKAYGLTGKPPVIGPNQAVEYDFEIVNVE